MSEHPTLQEFALADDLVIGDRRHPRDGTLSYDTVLASSLSGVECRDPSLASQSAADETDINTIVRRFHLTGQLPENVRVPLAEDFVDVFDFQSAQNALVEANRSFMAMPADVRYRFHNDAHEFVEFCTAERDGKLVNLEEMRKLGLAVPAPEVKIVEPMLVRVVPDVPDKE